MGESTKVGKRGAVVIPAKLRKRFRYRGGFIPSWWKRGRTGVVIPPAITVPFEVWSSERKARSFYTSVAILRSRRARAT